jgi:hypothetical protein
MTPTVISALLGIAIGTIMSTLIASYLCLGMSYLKQPIFGIFGIILTLSLVAGSFVTIDYALLDLHLQNHANRLMAIAMCSIIWGSTAITIVIKTSKKT